MEDVGGKKIPTWEDDRQFLSCPGIGDRSLLPALQGDH
jgi:hypothetical protein